MDGFDDTASPPDIRAVHLEFLLPTQQDEANIRKNMSILVARTLKKYMLFFEKYGQGIERHFMHQYSEEMSRKSHVVSHFFCVCVRKPTCSAVHISI